MVAKAEHWDITGKLLGYPGRNISESKTAYHASYGTHFTIFNSNVFIEGIGKVWYGDLDLTKDEQKLSKLALAFGRTVHVLREMDGRFDNEDRSVTDLGKVSVFATDGREGIIGEKDQSYFHRDEKGRLLQKEG